MTPGTKVAIISKSAAPDTHVAPSEEKARKDTPATPSAQEKADKNVSKVETPIAEKPKAASAPPPKSSPSEPQLPPKERERRVSLIFVICICIKSGGLLRIMPLCHSRGNIFL